MKKRIIFTLIGFLFILMGFNWMTSSFSIAYDGPKFPEGWPKPYYDFNKNPLQNNTIQLGRKLFYDPILSRDSTISCTSCHSQYNAFTHVDHALSHGIDGKIGVRNSPALMNLAWNKRFMWDGAVHHLDMQALAPISNKLEMDENIAHVVTKLQNTSTYPALFYQAFGDSVITGEHVLKSVSQFMLTFISANSKYDQVKKGNAEFTEMEQKGYKLFQNNCAKCHTEPLFTNNEFENNGLTIDTSLNDLGRYQITKIPADSFKFKVPTLRNIEFTYPYMHDGRFQNLNEVLNHYSKGIHSCSTLASSLKDGIPLTSNEKVELTAFLLTLTDKEFLFNKEFSYPR